VNPKTKERGPEGGLKKRLRCVSKSCKTPSGKKQARNNWKADLKGSERKQRKKGICTLERTSTCNVLVVGKVCLTLGRMKVRSHHCTIKRKAGKLGELEQDLQEMTTLLRLKKQWGPQ